MYTLEVFYPSHGSPHHVEEIPSAPEVLTRIADLLKEHDGCEKVVVSSGATRIFSVDCKGNRLPD